MRICSRRRGRSPRGPPDTSRRVAPRCMCMALSLHAGFSYISVSVYVSTLLYFCYVSVRTPLLLPPRGRLCVTHSERRAAFAKGLCRPGPLSTGRCLGCRSVLPARASRSIVRIVYVTSVVCLCMYLYPLGGGSLVLGVRPRSWRRGLFC